MSLGRLLSAGRTLVGLKETGGRYHLSSQRVLPRFESKKNPFRSSNTEAAELGTAASHTDKPTTEAAGPTAAAQAPAEGPKPEPRAHLSNPGKGLFSKLLAFLQRRRRNTTNQTAPRPPKGLVQAELSLESVRVVRNDLSDADLEIVPPKAAVKRRSPAENPGPVATGSDKQSDDATPASPAQAATAEGGSEQRDRDLKSATGALVGRLFGAGKP